MMYFEVICDIDFVISHFTYIFQAVISSLKASAFTYYVLKGITVLLPSSRHQLVNDTLGTEGEC